MISQKLVREKRPLGKKARAVTNEQGGKHKCREDSMPNPAPPRSGTVSGLKGLPPGTAQRLVVQEESNTLWVLGPAAPGKI